MRTSEILKKYKPDNENLLLILHDIQNHNSGHFITKEDIKEVSHYLNVPLSHVYGVVTYYSMLSVQKRGKYIIRLCQSPVCDMIDKTMIIGALEKSLNIKTGETTDDGLFTLELSECLGHCQISPAMTINNEIFGNLTAEKAIKIIHKYRK
jgi:NADH-quinone oxidoreductase subunit E